MLTPQLTLLQGLSCRGFSRTSQIIPSFAYCLTFQSQGSAQYVAKALTVLQSMP